MTIKKNFALAVIDSEKINELYPIIVDYANIAIQSSSPLYFDTQPIDSNKLEQDMIFFQLTTEDEKSFDEKLNELIEKLNQIDVKYGLKNEDTGEIIVSVYCVGSLDIKFDNIKTIKEGTYKKIDELKNLRTEFGSCKGYKPNFRPLESQSVEDLIVLPESIYLFSNSTENMSKLKEYISEKILEINPNFKIEFRSFSENNPE